MLRDTPAQPQWSPSTENDDDNQPIAILEFESLEAPQGFLSDEEFNKVCADASAVLESVISIPTKPGSLVHLTA